VGTDLHLDITMASDTSLSAGLEVIGNCLDPHAMLSQVCLGIPKHANSDSSKVLAGAHW